jgi:hypothetical protein
MNDKEIDGRFMALVKQREDALNHVVILTGENVRLKAELEDKNKVTKIDKKAS